MKSRRQRQQLASSDVVQEQQRREFQGSRIKPCPELVIQFSQLSWTLWRYTRNLHAKQTSCSQQICILILQSIMLMYLSAFGELRFDCDCAEDAKAWGQLSLIPGPCRWEVPAKAQHAQLPCSCSLVATVPGKGLAPGQLHSSRQVLGMVWDLGQARDHLQ